MIKRIIKEFIILLTFALILLINFSYAEDFYYDELQSTGYTQMKDILEAKKNGDRIMIPGKISGEYINEEAVAYVQEHIEDFEPYYSRNDERRKTVNDFIRGQEEEYYIEEIKNDDNTNIEQNDNKEILTAEHTFIKVEFIIILAIVMVLILFLFIIKRKKFLLVIDFVVLTLILTSLIINHVKNGNKTIVNNEETSAPHIEKVRKWRVKAIDNYDKETKDLLDLLNGNKIDKKLEEFAEKYKRENIDIYNVNEVDLSRVVNDYIIKCYYCVKRKANGKELYSDDIDVLNCFNDPNYNYDLKYYSNGYTSPEELYKYEFKIENSLLSKESMKGIYDNITEEDLRDYKDGVYLDKLIDKIGLIIKSKEDFDAYSIIPYRYFNIVRLNLEPLYKCKYWYLEKGQDTELKLPYDTTLKYEVAKYEKIDVEKWYYAEIKKMTSDYDNERTIFAYYLDNQNNLNGLYTTVYRDGLYNLKELTDEIKYPNIDIYTNTKNYDIDIKKIDNRLLVGSVLYSIDKTAIDYRTEEIFTNNFLNKYYELGIFPEYNFSTLNDITSDYINDEKRNLNKIICEVRDRKTRKVYNILFNVKWIDDKVDDIEYYIIPEDKMNLSYEEMYQLAFND